MNERIKNLREQSLSAAPVLDHERAVLLTEFYRSGIPEKSSVPVTRALSFKYLLEHKQICINPGELIVGERGPAPKATPTYPELCTHSLQDLKILNSREKISFRVDDETRRIYQDSIIPFWEGRSIRDRIFSEMDETWKAAYEAGIFTEFMEQRAPGHTVLGGKIYSKGMLDFMDEIQQQIDNLDFFNDQSACEKREELGAMKIAAGALVEFAERHAQKARELAQREEIPGVKRNCRKLLKPASGCRRMHPVIFGKRSSITGSSIWGSSPN